MSAWVSHRQRGFKKRVLSEKLENYPRWPANLRLQSALNAAQFLFECSFEAYDKTLSILVY